MRLSDINLRDPYILPWQGRYYLYGTRAATCWGPADGFDAYVSADLERWSSPVEVFHNDGSFWADRNYWAPEVHRWRDAFYMLASFKAEGRCRGTAVLKAKDPLGPFVPWSRGPVTPPEWEALDGTLYVSPEGQPYMVFCHEWVQCGDGEVCAQQLTEDLRAAAGEPFLLFRGSSAPWAREVRHSSGRAGYVTDGPFLWRGEDGRLYCLWAGFSDEGYTEGLAVSQSGALQGPYAQLPPLFKKDGGHGMLFNTFGGRTLLTLHRPNAALQERPVLLATSTLTPPFPR